MQSNNDSVVVNGEEVMLRLVVVDRGTNNCFDLSGTGLPVLSWNKDCLRLVSP